LLAHVWKEPAFFLAHPRAIAAFGRECTRRGVLLVPSNKLPINRSNGSRVPHVANRDTEGSAGLTSILLMCVGEQKQGVDGLHQTGLPGEQMPGLSVRFMGIDNYSTASMTDRSRACLTMSRCQENHHKAERRRTIF
jgi:hypothetical protein